jgi:hypothetical protein
MLACAWNSSPALAPILGGQPDTVRRICLGGGTSTKLPCRSMAHFILA